MAQEFFSLELQKKAKKRKSGINLTIWVSIDCNKSGAYTVKESEKQKKNPQTSNRNELFSKNLRKSTSLCKSKVSRQHLQAIDPFQIKELLNSY
jgi:hypothetical protein